MVTEFVLYRADTPVWKVLEDLRANAETYSDYGVQYVYVESERGTLIGVVRLRDLVLSAGEKRLRDIMIGNPLYVLADTALEEVVQFFDRYPFYSVPVTDESQRMVGVVRRAHVEEAVGRGTSGTCSDSAVSSAARAPQHARARAGVPAPGVGRGESPVEHACRHDATVFEATILGLPAILFFIPIIGNLCGCSGNQAVAVSIRELALGLIKPEGRLASSVRSYRWASSMAPCLPWR